MISLAQFLRPDGPVDLPLVMLPGLAEHGEQHDLSLRSTPVRDHLKIRSSCGVDDLILW
jgi:hypothetical protein